METTKLTSSDNHSQVPSRDHSQVPSRGTRLAAGGTGSRDRGRRSGRVASGGAGAATARRMAHLDTETRALRHRVVTWALATGRTVDFDALTVVLACRSGLGGPLTRFTCEDVWRLWWLDLSQWCTDRRVPVPHGLAASMCALFAHLDATDGFAPGSDDHDDLVDAMEQAGALWRSGNTPVGAG